MKLDFLYKEKSGEKNIELDKTLIAQGLSGLAVGVLIGLTAYNKGMKGTKGKKGKKGKKKNK